MGKHLSTDTRAVHGVRLPVSPSTPSVSASRNSSVVDAIARALGSNKQFVSERDTVEMILPKTVEKKSNVDSDFSVNVGFKWSSISWRLQG